MKYVFGIVTAGMISLMALAACEKPETTTPADPVEEAAPTPAPGEGEAAPTPVLTDTPQ